MAKVIEEQYTYSETVYYDDEGNELGRERKHNDSLYDILEEREMTAEEREDWLGA